MSAATDDHGTGSPAPTDAGEGEQDLLDRVRAWIAADPEPETAAELTALLAEADRPEPPGNDTGHHTGNDTGTGHHTGNDTGTGHHTGDGTGTGHGTGDDTGDDGAGPRAAALADLADRFRGPLTFGTAGLRGRMGAGENRMNRAVVIRAAAGVAAYARDELRAAGDHGRPRVVIGYDARTGSDVFASDTAAVVTAAGCDALLLPAPLPTPVLAFAVRALTADVGVMVTASHNPPQDNGYKVYLGGRLAPGAGCGAQIVPPADRGIAARIDAAGPARDIPRAGYGWTTLGPDVLEDYLASAVAVLTPGGPRELSIVLTPLHGVGGAPVAEALARGGFGDVFLVPEQAEPDPAFPTVAFPNPEEAGALDHALAHARSRGADLVIANDPDADRCAVAFPDPVCGWRTLHGDELGWLLADHLLRIHRGGLPDSATVACSIVSSRMLGRIAAEHGVRHVETLTGFKWITRVAGLVFGYEEALGYCVAPDAVRDKDGVSAALLAAELTAGLRADGRTLADALDDLALRHGVHTTDQLSLRVERVEEIATMMHRVRTAPPAMLGDDPVVAVDDLARPDPDGGLPPTDGIRLTTAGRTRVVVRPSGTEPKLKCYLEVILDVPEGKADQLPQTRGAARARLAAARESMHAALAG